MEILNPDLLKFLKFDYKIIKSSPCTNNCYIIKLEHLLSAEHEILKVIDATKVDKERIKKYLNALELVNNIQDKHNYLVKYTMIKEENGYIFLKMPEFIGSMRCEDISIYPLYENMKNENKKTNNKCDKDEDEDDEDEDDGDDDDDDDKIDGDDDDDDGEKDDEEDIDKDDENDDDGEKKEKNNKKIIYRGGKGSLRYNAYYDICYSVYLLHSNSLIHGNISKENIFYNKKHFYLSDYCQYLLFDKDDEKTPEEDREYSVRKDIYRLGKIQKYLSKHVPRGFFFDTYKRIDESRYCDEVIKQLWEKTQNYDFKTTEELLKILEKWEKQYEKDPSNSDTFSYIADEADSAKCKADKLKKKNNKLLARIFVLEKEKKEYIDRIEELENEIENLKKGNNKTPMKRKKLERN